MVRIFIFVLLLLGVPAAAQNRVVGDPTLGLVWYHVSDTPATVIEMGVVEASAQTTTMETVAAMGQQRMRPATFMETVIFLIEAHEELAGRTVVSIGSFADARGGVVVQVFRIRSGMIDVTTAPANTRWPAGTMFICVEVRPLPVTA